MTQKQSVVIIGGGPAGLTAAWEFVNNGGSDTYDVTVLEETQEFGGISRTVKHNGNRMDIGGHRFFSKDDRIMDWWKDVLPLQGAPSYDDKKLGREHDMEPGGPDPETTDQVMLKRHRVSRIYWNRRFFDYPISLSANTFKAMGFKLTMVAGFSYLKSMFHKLPETSLENFYINRFGRKLYSMFFEGYTEKLWGRHPSQISADWGAQRVKGLSILGVLKNAFRKLSPKKRKGEVETSLIEEFWYPKLGPGASTPVPPSSPMPRSSRFVRHRAVSNPWSTSPRTASAPNCTPTSSSRPCPSRTSSTPSMRRLMTMTPKRLRRLSRRT